jgi:CRISPR system Cascade subunit CasD
MPAFLLMRLEGPLMAFGSTAVDHHRPVQAWPAASMLTGLLANALGWHSGDVVALERLQSRLRYAVRIDRVGQPLKDFQTAQLRREDKGWTRRGVVEERAGGAEAYALPHLCSRDYWADASVLVALRLQDTTEEPTVAQLSQALRFPARPLFLGRKSCLPASPVNLGLVQADDAVAALQEVASLQAAIKGQPLKPAPIYCTQGAGATASKTATGPWRVRHTSDERRFALDVHAGRQQIFELSVETPARAAR